MSAKSNACCLPFFSSRNLSAGKIRIQPITEGQVSSTRQNQLQVLPEDLDTMRLEHDSLKKKHSQIMKRKQKDNNDTQMLSARQNYPFIQQNIVINTHTHKQTILNEKLISSGSKGHFHIKNEYETEHKTSQNQLALKFIRHSNDIKNSDDSSTKDGNSQSSRGSKSIANNLYSQNIPKNSNSKNSISNTQKVEKSQNRNKIVSNSKYYNNHNDDFQKETLDLVEQILNQLQSLDAEQLKTILQNQFVKQFADHQVQSGVDDIKYDLNLNEEQEKDQISYRDMNFSNMINNTNKRHQLQQIKKISRSQVQNLDNFEITRKPSDHFNSQKLFNSELKHQDSVDFVRIGSPVNQQKINMYSKVTRGEQSKHTNNLEQQNSNQHNYKIKSKILQIQTQNQIKQINLNNNNNDVSLQNDQARNNAQEILNLDSQIKIPYFSQFQISSNPTNDMTLDKIKSEYTLGSEVILCDSISSVNTENLI